MNTFIAIKMLFLIAFIQSSMERSYDTLFEELLSQLKPLVLKLHQREGKLIEIGNYVFKIL